jgi:hypothetical protein
MASSTESETSKSEQIRLASKLSDRDRMKARQAGSSDVKVVKQPLK